MGKMNQKPVDFENYSHIYIWIDQQFVRCLINVESWIAASFFELPRVPNELAVQRLDEWIKKYLPRKLSNELWKFVQGKQECIEEFSIFITDKTDNNPVGVEEKK
jgi:hypothetical protein